jgi:2-polyprenyl-6-methoxyphenol hydroxylase-like FAD-dependent oxidoreductase
VPLLHAYERGRRPANAALIRWSHWMSRFYAAPGPLGDWLRRKVFAFGGSALGRRVRQRLWTRMATRPANEGD